MTVEAGREGGHTHADTHTGTHTDTHTDTHTQQQYHTCHNLPVTHTHTHTHSLSLSHTHTQEVPIIGILGKGDALEGFEAENAAAVSKGGAHGFSASVQKPLDLQKVEALLGRLCTAGVEAGSGGGGSASAQKAQEPKSSGKGFEKGESSELQQRDPTKREKRSLRILVVEDIPNPSILTSTPYT